MNEIDLRRIDLNLLPVFEVLMEERHVSRAAARLGRTQSAVSHALERLRKQLGDPLLVRIDGAMRPSPFALHLMTELRPVLRSVQRVLAPREVFDPATSERRFRLVLPDFWHGAVAAFLAKASREAPGVSLEWFAPRDSSLLDLLAAHVDLVVAPTGMGLVEGIRSMPIGALSWQSFMRTGHPALRNWGRKAWLRHPHVVVMVGDRMQSPVQAAGAMALERRVGAYVPNFSAVAPLLARTDMIATLPTLAIGESAQHYGLMAKPPPLVIPPIAHSLFWSTQHGNEPALKWLRHALEPMLAIRQCATAQLPIPEH